MLGSFLLLAAILAPQCLCATLPEEECVFTQLCERFPGDIDGYYDKIASVSAWYWVADFSWSYSVYEYDYIIDYIDCDVWFVEYYLAGELVYVESFAITSYDTNYFVLNDGAITVRHWLIDGIRVSYWMTCDGAVSFIIAFDWSKYSNTCTQLLFPHVLWIFQNLGYSFTIHSDIQYWISQNHPDAIILTEQDIIARYTTILESYDCISNDCTYEYDDGEYYIDEEITSVYTQVINEDEYLSETDTSYDLTENGADNSGDGYNNEDSDDDTDDSDDEDNDEEFYYDSGDSSNNGSDDNEGIDYGFADDDGYDSDDDIGILFIDEIIEDVVNVFTSKDGTNDGDCIDDEGVYYIDDGVNLFTGVDEEYTEDGSDSNGDDSDESCDEDSDDSDGDDNGEDSDDDSSDYSDGSSEESEYGCFK